MAPLHMWKNYKGQSYAANGTGWSHLKMVSASLVCTKEQQWSVVEFCGQKFNSSWNSLTSVNSVWCQVYDTMGCVQVYQNV
jgi:hypothetical protein